MTIAMSPTILLLGAVALYLLRLSDEWLRQAFAIKSLTMKNAANPLRPFLAIGDSPWLAKWGELFGDIIDPLARIVRPDWSWSELGFAFTSLIVKCSIGGLIGGTIVRLTSLRFARKPQGSLRAAIKHSQRQYLSYLVAPALPLMGVGILAIVGWLLGVCVSIAPDIGKPSLNAAWGLLLPLGLAMAVLLNVVALGWPLMVAAISTEDSDGFDGLARSYGLVVDHPFYAAFLICAAGAIGAVGLSLIQLLFDQAGLMATWSVALGYGSEIPRVTADWLSFWKMLSMGYAVSYFWSAWTVIYMLLRHCDDGTSLEEVAPDQVDKVVDESARQTEPEVASNS